MHNSEDNDFLNIYFKEIIQYPLLTHEEEIELGKRICKGDEEAVNKLINSNLRLVVHIAKKFQKKGKSLTELILEGNAGLVRAAKKYDYRKGRFPTYADWWITQGIIKCISDNSGIIRFSFHQNELARKKERAENELISRNHHMPTLKEAAEHLKIPYKKLVKLSLMKNIIYLDSVEQNSFLFHDKRENLEEDFVYNNLGKDIESILSSVLTKREAEIIRRRFGLYAGRKGKGESHKLIGMRYGLTKQRIEQIEKRALRKLKNPEVKRVLEGYLS